MLVPAVLAASALRAAPAEPARLGAATERDPLWISLAGDRTLAGHDAVFDVVSRTMVLHGGERQPFIPPQDIRQLDLGSTIGAWTSLAASGDAPVARLQDRGLIGSAAIIDPVEQVMLAVCDCRDGSTYLLDLKTKTWSRAPGDREMPLWFPVLVYDAPRDRAVLYGGNIKGDAGSEFISNAGWAYDLSPARTGWSPLPPAPFKRLYAAGDIDLRSQHLLVFGGEDPSANFTNTLWRLDLTRVEAPDSWQDISALVGPGPEGREGATLTFDPETGRAVLYGGHTPQGDLDDAWVLDYAQPDSPEWYHLHFDETGGATRAGHSAVWDSANRYVIIYGGSRTEDAAVDFLDDTWALDPGFGAGPVPTIPPAPTPTATTPATISPPPAFIPLTLKNVRMR
jgi:hypothetical protein